MGPMGKDQKNTIAVLDIGSAKTVALICDVSDSGLRYRGHATTESRGSRKGVLVELDKAVQSIQRAVEAAEKMAECTVGNAVISIGGAHIKGITSRGGISLGSRPREVTREDVRAAVEKARSINLPPDREVLHLLQQEFILDDQAGVRDPAGMMASRLEVNLHLVTSSASDLKDVPSRASRRRRVRELECRFAATTSIPGRLPASGTSWSRTWPATPGRGRRRASSAEHCRSQALAVSSFACGSDRSSSAASNAARFASASKRGRTPKTGS